MNIKINSIEEFFETIEDRKEDMLLLDKFIVNTAPELKRQLLNDSNIPMIGYGEVNYRNDRHSRNWPLIGIAPKRNYISIFLAAEKEGIPLAEIYNEHILGKVSNGKHCIRFKNIKDLNMEEMKNLIKDAIEWNENN